MYVSSLSPFICQFLHVAVRIWIDLVLRFVGYTHPLWMPMERNNYINFMQCTGLLELTDLTQTKAMKSSEWIKLLYDNMVMIRTLKIQALA